VNVLVTGATTPLGRAIVAQLLASRDLGHVLAVGQERWGPGLPSDGARFTYERTDLTRARNVHDLLHGPTRAHGIDTVLHGVLHRAARDRGERIHAINVEATRMLLLGCARHPGIRRFVLRSGAEVYALRRDEPNLLDEDHPLVFDPAAPQWLRDRVEADLLTCAQIAAGPMSIAVLRCAEILADGIGSQLWDYLGSRVCLRPLGFDPMINVLSIEDAVAGIVRALATSARGVFNLPGFDTLPLSRLIAWSGRRDVPVPGPLLAPLYWLRTRTVGFAFRYDLNLRRFHLGGVLDGARARAILGYEPRHPLVPPVRPAASWARGGGAVAPAGRPGS
jgi:UDP-glucose 4-epimerase